MVAANSIARTSSASPRAGHSRHSLWPACSVSPSGSCQLLHRRDARPCRGSPPSSRSVCLPSRAPWAEASLRCQAHVGCGGPSESTHRPSQGREVAKLQTPSGYATVCIYYDLRCVINLGCAAVSHSAFAGLLVATWSGTLIYCVLESTKQASLRTGISSRSTVSTNRIDIAIGQRYRDIEVHTI